MFVFGHYDYEIFDFLYINYGKSISFFLTGNIINIILWFFPVFIVFLFIFIYIFFFISKKR